MQKKYLFTGEESYLLHKELTKWIQGFQEKYGSDSVVRLSLVDYSIQDIIHHLCMNGLFVEQKMIVIDSIPGETTSIKGTSELEEEIINHWSSINSEYIVIFVSQKPDKRKKAYKFFSEQCDIKSFAALDRRGIGAFVHSEFKTGLDKHHATVDLSPEQSDLIIDLVGNDGWRLHNECRKLSSFVNSGGDINKENIIHIVTPSQESTAFELTDAIIMHDDKRLLQIIDILGKSGETRQGIQGGLLWGLKQLVSYGAIASSGKDVKSLGLAPFVLGKYNKYSDYIIHNRNNLLNLYRNMIQFDYKVKKGDQSEESYRLFIKENLQHNNLLNSR